MRSIILLGSTFKTTILYEEYYLTWPSFKTTLLKRKFAKISTLVGMVLEGAIAFTLDAFCVVAPCDTVCLGLQLDSIVGSRTKASTA